MKNYEKLLKEMTLEEKAALLTGKGEWQTWEIERLGIPSIFCSDGPHGIRKQAGEGDHLGLNASLPATCFPTAATVANSWDTELAERMASALGDEALAQGVQVLLGPGLNIKRSPLCGRNFEYFSEDPYLSGKMAAAYVRGIQSSGVAACPKHFAVNSQELRRMAMNAVVDERTMREIYLTAFEMAVKEGNAKALMTSYNEVNGTYANENQHLLQDILRKEWGFEGIVVTDWGASNDHVSAVKLNSNLEMPAAGLESARQIVAAVQDGSLTEAELDETVGTLLKAIIELSVNSENRPSGYDTDTHHALAEEAAEQSIVLLKNEGNILPLKAHTKVAVIGDFAEKPRFQGAGSSLVNPTREVRSLYDELKECQDIEVIGFAKGYLRNGKKDVALSEEARKLAGEAEVVVYCFGLTENSESEGLDRSHMRLPENQIELLSCIKKTGVPVVGVLYAGSAVELGCEESCTALLHGYLGGQAGAHAMLRVLTGQVNPSGKLAETYPLRYEDVPSAPYYPSRKRNSEYRESLYVGYRYYETAKVPVRYPFGYGLSYTTFFYDALQIEEDRVRFRITNTGTVDGSEIAQLYVGMKNGKVFRPAKELKGFQKVFLHAGESKEVEILFDDKTFRYWNTETNSWEIEGGTYQIMIGHHASAVDLSAELQIKASVERVQDDRVVLPDYYSGQIKNISNAEYERLLGTPIPEDVWSGTLKANDALCRMEHAKSGLARLVYRILTGLIHSSEKKGSPNLNLLFIYNMPFRGIGKMTGGMVDSEMVDGMVTAVNGHVFRGIGVILSGFFRNKKENKQYLKKHLMKR